MLRASRAQVYGHALQINLRNSIGPGRGRETNVAQIYTNLRGKMGLDGSIERCRGTKSLPASSLHRREFRQSLVTYSVHNIYTPMQLRGWDYRGCPYRRPDNYPSTLSRVSNTDINTPPIITPTAVLLYLDIYCTAYKASARA